MAPVPGSQLLLLLHVLREARGALSASLAQAGAQGGGGQLTATTTQGGGCACGGSSSGAMRGWRD